MSNPITYPIRLNRYLYLQNICSRREADRLISTGQVLVNGQVALLGQRISETDVVDLSPDAQRKTQAKKYYLAFHKPVGVVSHNPTPGELGVEDYLSDIQARLSPIGRLDKASSGLLLLSNDGTIVHKVLNPQFQHEKEYLVEVDKRLSQEFLLRMREGVNIEGYRTRPAVIEKINSRVFRLILTEGKKHQIRRMCAALGYQVHSLIRIRIMNIHLGTLKPGCSRHLGEQELVDFLISLNH